MDGSRTTTDNSKYCPHYCTGSPRFVIELVDKKRTKPKKHRKKIVSLGILFYSEQSYQRQNILYVIITYLGFTNYRQQFARLVSPDMKP